MIVSGESLIFRARDVPMKDICLFPLCLTVIFAGNLLSADDSTPALPKEGAWTKYHVIMRLDNGTEVKFTERISLLGGEQWNGELCRWIEIEENYESQEKPQVHRLLVPEKELLQAERPLDHVKRYISKEDNQVTVHTDDQTLARASLLGPVVVFLPGPFQGTKTIAELKKFDYQSGRLLIENARKGSFTWERKYNTPDRKEISKWDYTIWVHKDVPFGFAHARMKRTLHINSAVRTTDFEFHLNDVGTGAKSAIADGGG